MLFTVRLGSQQIDLAGKSGGFWFCKLWLLSAIGGGFGGGRRLHGPGVRRRNLRFTRALSLRAPLR